MADEIDKTTGTEEPLRLGSALVELFQPFGGIDLEIERDRTSPEPINFD